MKKKFKSMNKNISWKILKLLFIFVGTPFIFVSVLVFFYSLNNNISFVTACLLSLKNLGAYGTLLAAIVGTIIYGEFKRNQELQEKESIHRKEIVDSIGRMNFEPYRENEEKNDDVKKLIAARNIQNIYLENGEYKDWLGKHTIVFYLKLVSSKETELRNVMIFEDTYFEKNKTHILNNYFDFFEKINYYDLVVINSNNEINKYVGMNNLGDPGPKKHKLYLTAITVQGYIVIIKILYFIEEQKVIRLLPQMQYYAKDGDMIPIYNT